MASATYDADRYDKNGYSIGFSRLDDGSSHLLGLTEAAPGQVISSRYTPRSDAAYQTTIRFMEYNVLVDGSDPNDPDDVVESEALLVTNRANKVLESVTEFDPDVAVFTEFNYAWWNAFQPFLQGAGSKYACLGHSDSDHELATMSGLWDSTKMIMYNTEKYDLIDQGYFWACATPNQRNYYFTGKLRLHASLCFNWAKLQDKTTGAPFFVLAIHPFANAQGLYDVNAAYGYADRSEVGNLVRNYTANLVISQLEQLVGDMPSIIAGDFNSQENTEAYKIYTAAGYENARDIDRETTFLLSCPGLKTSKDLYKGLPIDHILLSENDFVVSDYQVNTKQLTDDYFPSDHLPTQAVLTMKYEPGPFALNPYSTVSVQDGYLFLYMKQIAFSSIVNEFAQPDRYQWDGSRTEAATGMTLRYMPDPVQYLTLILRGDLNGDGQITSTDYILLKRFFKGISALNSPFDKAADYDGNGRLTATDYLKIKQYFQGQ